MPNPLDIQDPIVRTQSPKNRIMALARRREHTHSNTIPFMLFSRTPLNAPSTAPARERGKSFVISKKPAMATPARGRGKTF